MNKIAMIERPAKMVEVCPHCAQPMPKRPARAVISVPGLVVDTEKMKAWWKGTDLEATKSEVRILAALIARPGAARHREALLDSAFGVGSANDPRGVDAHVKRIRRKIESIDPNFNMIEMVYGVGYRWRDQGATG